MAPSWPALLEGLDQGSLCKTLPVSLWLVCLSGTELLFVEMFQDILVYLQCMNMYTAVEHSFIYSECKGYYVCMDTCCGHRGATFGDSVKNFSTQGNILD